jgi:hypothetical protein
LAQPEYAAMKPLPVLTEEDWCVWLRLRGGQFDAARDDRWLDVIDSYEESDRRDAALMSALMEFGPMSNGYAWAHRALRGAVDRGDSICIDGYWVALA